MDAEGLAKKASDTLKDRATERLNKLKVYEEAMLQDKAFQSRCSFQNLLLTKIETCLESMKKMNSYFEQTSKQKSVLLQNCSVMAQLARALI
jgi:hypothetical protein